MDIPYSIKKIIGDRSYSIDKVGMSDAQVICFEDMVLKVEKQQDEFDVEYNMMVWLADKLPVPKVLGIEKEKGINYLLMSRIEGEMACSENNMKNSENLIKLLAKGLNMFRSVDISNCPYYYSIDSKLRLAEIRVQNNLCSIEDAEPETYGKNGFKNPAQLLEWLKQNKPKEELAFSHGDYCLPNIFIKENQISGFLDLGRSGVADIYQDIALCYRSLQHNCDGAYGGKVYQDINAALLFDELEIVPDWDKIKYYILLDELF